MRKSIRDLTETNVNVCLGCFVVPFLNVGPFDVAPEIEVYFLWRILGNRPKIRTKQTGREGWSWDFFNVIHTLESTFSPFCGPGQGVLHRIVWTSSYKSKDIDPRHIQRSILADFLGWYHTPKVMCPPLHCWMLGYMCGYTSIPLPYCNCR